MMNSQIWMETEYKTEYKTWKDTAVLVLTLLNRRTLEVREIFVFSPQNTFTPPA
jgi:hypothetical protein